MVPVLRQSPFNKSMQKGAILTKWEVYAISLLPRASQPLGKCASYTAAASSAAKLCCQQNNYLSQQQKAPHVAEPFVFTELPASYPHSAPE